MIVCFMHDRISSVITQTQDRLAYCWVDLHQLAQRSTGPLTRALIGSAQPKIRLVGPRRVAP